MLFFPPPPQRYDPCPWVTEDANHGLDWTKAGKSVSIPQALVSLHPPIMPDLLAIKIALPPSIASRFSRCFYPLALEKTQNIFHGRFYILLS